MTKPAVRIHQALEAVALIRQRRLAEPPLAIATAGVKQFQAARFRATYADLLGDKRYRTAAKFFLTELYGDKNYAERDQQFARIADTIVRIFPQAVANTAASLAEVHALTESLDEAMALQWMRHPAPQDLPNACHVYIACWRTAADAPARQHQLASVVALGQELNRLTRRPGLRTLLKMMRRPAELAGLGSLQTFLETGFDAFADMQGAEDFLACVSQREAEWIDGLFAGDAVACETKLAALLQ